MHRIELYLESNSWKSCVDAYRSILRDALRLLTPYRKETLMKPSITQSFYSFILISSAMLFNSQASALSVVDRAISGSARAARNITNAALDVPRDVLVRHQNEVVDRKTEDILDEIQGRRASARQNFPASLDPEKAAIEKQMDDVLDTYRQKAAQLFRELTPQQQEAIRSDIAAWKVTSPRDLARLKRLGEKLQNIRNFLTYREFNAREIPTFIAEIKQDIPADASLLRTGLSNWLNAMAPLTEEWPTMDRLVGFKLPGLGRAIVRIAAHPLSEEASAQFAPDGDKALTELLYKIRKDAQLGRSFEEQRNNLFLGLRALIIGAYLASAQLNRPARVVAK